MSKQILIILGMKRSGNSCLAGCLEQCGLRVVDYNRAERKDGYAEKDSLRTLHEQILARNGGSWYRPPQRVIIPKGHRTRISKIVQRLKQSRASVGIKDSGTLLVRNTWLAMLGNCQIVGTFCHPHTSADTFAERYSLSTDQSLRLWARYNSELVRLHKSLRFPLIEYDPSDTSAYVEKVLQVAKSLRLQPVRVQVATFAATRLRRVSKESGPVTAACRKTYNYLRCNSRSTQTHFAEMPRPHLIDMANEAARNSYLQAAHSPPNLQFTEN